MPYRDAINRDDLKYRAGNLLTKNSGMRSDSDSDLDPDFLRESCKCLILPFPISESPNLSRQQEMNALQKVAEYLKNVLDSISKRIRSLKLKK